VPGKVSRTSIARRSPRDRQQRTRSPFAYAGATGGKGGDALCFAVLMLAWPALHAQTPPGAGSVLRETAPGAPRPALPVPAAPALPPPPSAGPAATQDRPALRFTLRQVEFSGNTVFSTPVLAALVADQIGQPVTFAELEAMAARVGAHYRNAGYVLAQVVLPPQTVGAGRVVFSVIEGRLGQVRLETQGVLSMPERVPRAVLAPLRPGRPLHRGGLERAMLLLTDLPGLAPQSALESGAAPGTFDLVVELKPAPRVSFSVDVDNYGARATREVRAGGFARIKSPFGIGDNLDLRILSSAGKGLAFGRVGYEAPLGYTGLRASVAYAHLEYELVKELAVLDASGRAKVAEAALSYPFLRARLNNLFGRLSAEHKVLRDQLGALAQSSDKTIDSVGAGLVYEGRDGRGRGGYTNAGLTLYFGKLQIGSSQDLAIDQGPDGLGTDGHATRVVYQASRLQSVSAQTSVLLAVAGQWASRNLDSAEKIAAGGPRAVRAYPVSAGLGDDVHVLNAEYRWSWRPEAAAGLFYDAGWVRAVNHDPLPGADNRRTLRGAGLGLFWNGRGGLSLRTSLAWRMGPREAGVRDRQPRLFAQLAHAF
jgi:hemolysin activation/secretion protein